jgi:hypothetical protein
MVQEEAHHLLPSFRNKSIGARKKVTACFTKMMGLTCNDVTHTAQKNVHETEDEPKHFIAMMKDKILGKINVI